MKKLLFIFFVFALTFAVMLASASPPASMGSGSEIMAISGIHVGKVPTEMIVMTYDAFQTKMATALDIGQQQNTLALQHDAARPGAFLAANYTALRLRQTRHAPEASYRLAVYILDTGAYMRMHSTVRV